MTMLHINCLSIVKRPFSVLIDSNGKNKNKINKSAEVNKILIAGLFGIFFYQAALNVIYLFTYAVTLLGKGKKMYLQDGVFNGIMYNGVRKMKVCFTGS